MEENRTTTEQETVSPAEQGKGSLKYVWIALILTVLAVLMGVLSAFEFTILAPLFVACVAVALAFYAIAFCMWLTARLKKTLPSPHVIFLIVVGVLAIASAAWAVYDIRTDVGWFAGLGGFLMLLFGTSTLALLLVIDGIVMLVQWLRKRRQVRKTEINT